MSIPEFSLRLQEGIQGGFAPPTPNAIFTVTKNAIENHLQISTAIRPSGTPSLQDSVPKIISATNDHTIALVTELREILQSIPTESPPGVEDIYGLNTSIAFGTDDFMWVNGGPQGCGRGTSQVQPTQEEKAQFKRAVEIVQELVSKDA